MSGPWAGVLVFAAAVAVVFWGLWVGIVLLLRWRQRRGIEPTRVQVEAREWPAAIALGFTALALLAWLIG